MRAPRRSQSQAKAVCPSFFSLSLLSLASDKQTVAAAIDKVPDRNLDAKTASGSSPSSIAILQAAASSLSIGVGGGAPGVRRLRLPVIGSRTEGPTTTLAHRLELERERIRCRLKVHEYAQGPSWTDGHSGPRIGRARLSIHMIVVLP
jgi:hypothetical protein